MVMFRSFACNSRPVGPQQCFAFRRPPSTREVTSHPFGVGVLTVAVTFECYRHLAVLIRKKDWPG